MQEFQNAAGQMVVETMIAAIQQSKAYLSEIDGLIGDGDHGANMNKGFTLCQTRMEGQHLCFTEALETLGMVLFNEIGGSMGPIYGTIFMAMATAGANHEVINGPTLAAMLNQAVTELGEVIQAQTGDKTLMDTLLPARETFCTSLAAGADFSTALKHMCAAAEQGKESTRDLVAKYGRSSCLGERSRGALDAGAVSCYIILRAMAEGIQRLLGLENKK